MTCIACEFYLNKAVIKKRKSIFNAIWKSLKNMPEHRKKKTVRGAGRWGHRERTTDPVEPRQSYRAKNTSKQGGILRGKTGKSSLEPQGLVSWSVDQASPGPGQHQGAAGNGRLNGEARALTQLLEPDHPHGQVQESLCMTHTSRNYLFC